jgi:tetratricopeptide (TPR) repeat protein
MKKNTYCFLIFLTLFGLLMTSCKDSSPEDKAEKQRQTQLKTQTKEQKKIKSKVDITLRAAHVAYNVKRYALAIEKYNIAVNAGWVDGIDLYQYADCLEREGKTEESKLFYQKAYNELQKFYPNHAFIHVLETKGYAGEE